MASEHRRVELVEYADEGSVPLDLLKVAVVDAATADVVPADVVPWEHVPGGGPGIVRVAGLRFPTTAPPPHLRKVALLNMAVVYDTFTRADSATLLGTGETGTAYTAVAGTWGISAGKAYTATDANLNRATLDPGLTEFVLEALVRGDFTNGSAYRTPMLLLHHTDVNNLIQVRLYPGGIFDLWKRVASAWTQLATSSNATASATDYLIRAHKKGNTLTCSVDGLTKITYTFSSAEQTAFNAVTPMGIMLEKVGAPSSPARWDNLRVSRA